MMAMLQCWLLAIVLVGCQIHTVESSVTFPTYPVVSISKDPTVNTAVITVTATDTDVTTLAYTVESQTPNTAPNVFSIEGGTGAIKVSDVTKLDYPNTKVYVLVIKATKSGNSPETATTTVTVSLVNKDPTFAKALYTVCVNKGLTGGTVVLQVTASDEDDKTLAYSITAGYDNLLFAVEASNGTIKVKSGETVGETPASYNLTLTATDDDAPVRTGTTTVSIDVDDPCQAVTPLPNYATTMTASFCLFLISGVVNLLRMCVSIRLLRHLSNSRLFWTLFMEKQFIVMKLCPRWRQQRPTQWNESCYIYDLY